MHERRGWWGRYKGTVAFVALIAVTVAGFFYVQSFSTALRDGLVKSCEQNGNPLREAVSGQLQYQLTQSHSFDYSLFFPTIPPRQLHELIHMQNQQVRAELDTIHPVDCESLYPR